MQLTDRQSERIARAICDFYKLDPKQHVIQITGDGPKLMTYLEWAKDGIANTLKVLDMCGYTLSDKRGLASLSRGDSRMTGRAFGLLESMLR